MMNNLHTTNNLLLKIILIVVILSFILPNISYLLNKNTNYVAKVNDHKISYDQFETAFSIENDRIKQQLKDLYKEISSKEQYLKNLRRQVLNNLINEVLIDQFVKRLGFNISDEQVKEAIFSTYEFQSNGRFDNSLYNSIIDQIGMSADQYVQALRNQLKIQKLIDIIISSDFILKCEIDELMELITQQRIVREAIIDINKMASKQQVNDIEIKNYYEQNKNIFFSPEQFRVSYIKLDANLIKVNISDSDIQSYYDQHQEEFTQPQLKKYSIIRTKTRSNAQIILTELNKGVDFTKIIKERSKDIISSKEGSDIGWLEDSATPYELKNAKLKNKGQISGIIKSSIGYLVIRLDDLKAAKTRPLIEVRDKILEKIRKKRMIDTFYSIQKEIIKKARNDNEHLIKAEHISGIASVETDWFSRYNLPKDLNFKPIVDIIFSDSLSYKNNILNNDSNIITINNDCAFVLRINDYKPETVEPLSKVKNKIINQIKYNKAAHQANLNVKKILINLKENKNSKIMETLGLKFSMPKVVNRNEEDPIIQAIFSLALPKKDNPSYGITNDMNGNIVLLALDEVRTRKISQAEKKIIIKDISKKNAQIYLEALINNLRKKAKIKISNSFKNSN